jgi:hypothetical protein
MARIKFVVFALVALGLWAYHLTKVSPLALAASVEQAEAAVSGAPAPVALAIEAQRSLVQAAALRVGGGPSAWNVGPKAGAKPEAPGVDRFSTVRGAANDVVPAEQREQLFVALVNDVGVLAGKGTGEPTTNAPEGLSLAEVAQAGAQGALRELDGVPTFLIAVPLVVSDKNEVRAAGHAVLGLPLLPDARALEVVKDSLGLTGVGIATDGKLLVSAGDKGQLERAATVSQDGRPGALAEGPARAIGPLNLPMFSGSPVHGLGLKSPLPGTSFEVLAAASAKASVDALADYQVFGLGGLAGLLLLSLVVTVLLGGGDDAGRPAMVVPQPMPVPVVAPPPRRDEPIAQAPLALPETEPAPEASPDDFDFPSSSASAASSSSSQVQSSPSAFAVSSPSSFPPPSNKDAMDEGEPMSDPFAAAAPPPPPARNPPPPPVSTAEVPAYRPAAGLMDDLEDGARTVNYPAFARPPVAEPPSADPFAQAAAQLGEQQLGEEDNPESTRVAAVPQELIRAARAGATAERPALKPTVTGTLPKVSPGPFDEDKHFQDVFRDFVATREKCGEPADGLTFDKFKVKLLKNKEQLVAKYACKTVRFQVYVKDGKAALKATPVKE